MQLKILKLGLLLILKIHRQIILARKVMKLVSDFLKITLYVMVSIFKLVDIDRPNYTEAPVKHREDSRT